MAVYNYPVHIALPDEDVITCLHKDEICAKNGVPIFCAFCPLCLRSLSAPVGDLSTSKYLQCEHIGRYHKKCLDSLGLKACLYCRPNLIKLTDEEATCTLICEMMPRLEKDAKAQILAYKAVARLSYRSPLRGQYLKQENIYRFISDSLSIHMEEEALVSVVLDVLICLCLPKSPTGAGCDTGSCSLLATSSIEGKLCAALRAYEGNVAICLKGITVISRLAAGDPSNIYLFEASGACEALCEFVERNISNYSVRSHGLETINALAYRNLTNDGKLVQAGAGGIIIKILRASLDDLTMLTYSLQVTAGLCLGEEQCALFYKEGVCGAVVDAMTSFETCRDVQLHGIRCVKNLAAFSSECRCALTPACALVCKAMNRLSDDVELLYHGVKAVGALASGDIHITGENKDTFSELGAPYILLHLLVDFSGANRDLELQCLRSLNSVVGLHVKNLTLAIDAGAVHIINRTLTTYAYDPEVQLEGRFLLQGMGAKGGKKSNDTWRGIVDTLAYITGISRGSSSIRDEGRMFGRSMSQRFMKRELTQGSMLGGRQESKKTLGFNVKSDTGKRSSGSGRGSFNGAHFIGGLLTGLFGDGDHRSSLGLVMERLSSGFIRKPSNPSNNAITLPASNNLPPPKEPPKVASADEGPSLSPLPRFLRSFSSKIASFKEPAQTTGSVIVNKPQANDELGSTMIPRFLKTLSSKSMRFFTSVKVLSVEASEEKESKDRSLDSIKEEHLDKHLKIAEENKVIAGEGKVVKKDRRPSTVAGNGKVSSKRNSPKASPKETKSKSGSSPKNGTGKKNPTINTTTSASKTLPSASPKGSGANEAPVANPNKKRLSTVVPEGRNPSPKPATDRINGDNDPKNINVNGEEDISSRQLEPDARAAEPQVVSLLANQASLMAEEDELPLFLQGLR